MGLSEAKRICPFCTEDTENEFHVLFNCVLHNDFVRNVFEAHSFMILTLVTSEKFKFLFSSPNMIRSYAEACFLILQRQYVFLTAFNSQNTIFRLFFDIYSGFDYFLMTMAIRTTVVPIRILIRTTVVPIRILIRTTAIISALS